jgi:hypothetical protein
MIFCDFLDLNNYRSRFFGLILSVTMIVALSMFLTIEISFEHVCRSEVHSSDPYEIVLTYISCCHDPLYEIVTPISLDLSATSVLPEIAVQLCIVLSDDLGPPLRTLGHQACPKAYMTWTSDLSLFVLNRVCDLPKAR